MTEKIDQHFGQVVYQNGVYTIREQSGRQQSYAVYTRESKGDVLDYFAATMLEARHWIINKGGVA